VNYDTRTHYPVTIIPPIIGKDVQGQTAAPVDKQVTVYISNASHIQQSVAEVFGVFSQFPDTAFNCFINAPDAAAPANVKVMPNGRAAFINCLRQSAAVIATAGHNLITESLYLHVPAFLLPFDHYEQQLNAQVISQEGVGTAADVITLDNLSAFLSNLDSYRQRRHESEILYNRFDGDEVFLALVETAAFSYASP